MRLLAVASMYPHPGLPYSGIFNQNCVEAAARAGHQMVVLAPRPYVPSFLSMHPRWKAYAQIPSYAEHQGIPVHRPNLIQVPKLNMTWQRNQGSYLQMLPATRKLHRQYNFDAIFSFDLGGAGGLAWRLGRQLGIPATGWAFGLDVRIPHEGGDADEMRRMLRELDLVYYQSSELRDCAGSYLPNEPLNPARHVVLPHGIPEVQAAPAGVRLQLRRQWDIPQDAVVVLFLSRIMRSKGTEELITAFARAAQQHPQLFGLIVGESPGFDDSPALHTQVEAFNLQQRIRVLPACQPQDVPRFHAAADIFAFPSKSEGMPNALLEAMALGTPSIVFDIPPIRDIIACGDCLQAVPCFDADAYGEALSTLVESEDRRQQLIKNARQVVAEHFDINTNMRQATELLAGMLAPA